MKQKNNNIIYKNYIPKSYLKYKNEINKKCSNIIKNIIENIDDTEDTYHSLSKKFKLNFKKNELKKFNKYNTVAIIGMGGSILGTEAIYYFLQKKIKKKFIFFNNIDENKLQKFKKNNKLDRILFIIVSKSGNTIETISNISALKIIKKRAKNIIIISEKAQNSIYEMSKKMELFHVEHKNYLAGRFSILSEVGMVPAYLMGINVVRIRKNLLSHFNKRKKIFLNESSKKLAILLNTKKIKSLVFFNYIPELNKFLFWCQQLIAESLGKNKKGFLPIISPAPKDHHSLLQLYLDGPKDKLFYVFSDNSIRKKNIKINTKIFDKKLNFMNNKDLSKIKMAQKNAFLQVLKNNQIPHREFKISAFNEESIGELFAYFMLETAIIGKLANLNPFNQPAVESVKVKTKNFLA